MFLVVNYTALCFYLKTEHVSTNSLAPMDYQFQIMTSRPRSDLYINLPALRKLDNMLLVSSTCSFSR